MNRIRQALKWLAIASAALTLAVIAASLWLLNSQSGLRTLLYLAAVQTERADGSLLGGFQIRRLRHAQLGIDRLEGAVDLGWTMRLQGLRLAGLSLSATDAAPIAAASDGTEAAPTGFSLPVLDYPLALELIDARIWNIRGVHPAMPLDELRLERVTLREGRLTITGAEVEYESLHAVLEGEIDSTRAWSHRITVHVSGGVNTVAGVRQIQARIDARGTVERSELKLVSEKPISSHLSVVLEQWLSTPTASFESTVAPFPPALVGYKDAPIETLAWQLQGRYAERLDLSGEVNINQTRLDIDLEQLALEGGVARMRRFAITAPDLAARIDVEGALSLPATTAKSTLIVQLAALPLGWPVAPSTPRATGSLRLEGHPEAMRARYRGELSSPSNNARVIADLLLEGEQLAIEQLELDDGRGTVRATGRLPTNGHGPVELQLNLAALDLSVVHPELAGPWAGLVELKTELVAWIPGRSSLHISDLQGRLRGLGVAGTAAIQGRGPLDAKGRLALSIGASQIDIEATDPAAPMLIELDLRDLAAIDPALDGEVSGQIEIQRSLLTPRMDLQLLAQELRHGDQTATDLRVNAVLSRDQSEQHVDIDIAELLAAGNRFEGIAARLTGSEKDHALQLRGLWRERRIEVALTGALDRQRNWRGRVERLAASDSEGALLAIEAPTMLVVGAGGALDVAAHCLSGVARLCTSATRSATGMIDATLTLEPVDLATVRDRSPELDQALGEYQLAGRVAIDARVVASQLVEATLSVDGGALTGAAMEPAEIRNVDGRLQAAPDGDTTRVRGQIGSSLGTLAVDAGVGEALTGTVTLDISDLAPLLASQSAMAESTGQARLRLDLAGTPQAPALGGELSLTGFGSEILPLGIRLSDGRARISQPAAQGPWQVEASVQAGAGALGINGELVWDPTASAVAGVVRINGKNASLIDMPSARIVASPELELELDGTSYRLRGEVAIDQAQLNVEKLEGGAAGASPDVVVIDDPEQAARGGLPLDSRVRLIFGEPVELSGYGVKAKLSGELEVRDRPGRPTTGRGELRLAGSIAQYGKDLELKRGRVLFGGGPIDNPGLDLLAERQIREVKAGVRISGSAAQPILTLVSEPRLPEGEILSYLVLGRPLAQAGDGEGAQLQAASAALGGALASSQIGQRLGLDEASIQDGALTVGKYLSPKLYLGYGTGLFEPGQFMTVRYDLRPWLTAELKSAATERSTRLVYRRESRE